MIFGQMGKVFLLLLCVLLTKVSNGQWIKDNIARTVYDSVVASYSWDDEGLSHVTWGSVTLYRGNRYKLILKSNISDEQSEGKYAVIKDTLILTSVISDENPISKQEKYSISCGNLTYIIPSL